MSLETFDEIHVRRLLKRAIAEEGGVIKFANKHKIRPRDLDIAMVGAPKNSVLRAIGYARSIRYVRLNQETSETQETPILRA